MVQDDQLTSLLESMPAIADVVNGFQSPEVQLAAFRALMTAAGLPVVSGGAHDGSSVSETKPQRATASKSKSKATGAKAAKKSKSAPTQIDKNLNIRPPGKKSLDEFAAEKGVVSNQDKSIVCIYWMTKIAGYEPVGLQQVVTCYRLMQWKIPTNPANQLQTLAAAKGWLDTSDREAIVLTVAGEQYVEIDLPKQ